MKPKTWKTHRRCAKCLSKEDKTVFMMCRALKKEKGKEPMFLLNCPMCKWETKSNWNGK